MKLLLHFKGFKTYISLISFKALLFNVFICFIIITFVFIIFKDIMSI
jgi:hypothetical protein